ncbi:MFS transporter [Stackebrandtia soli]|uniref:MFS transporter n=1 Tax=Stackebrandtia soli TaxID=1892856 RepID=UPI0039EAECDC
MRESILALNADFRRMWMAFVISGLGSAVTMIALPLIALFILDATAFEIGLLTSMGTLPLIVIGLPAGAWIDRVRKRTVLIVTDLVRAVVLLSVPIATWLGVLTIGQLYVVAVLTGVASIFFGAANVGYVSLLVKGDDLTKGYAAMETGGALTNVVGPAAGGFLIQWLAAPIALVVDAASFLASAVLKGRIRAVEPEPKRSPDRRLSKEIAEGLRFVVNEPTLRVIVTSTAALALFNVMVNAMLVVWLTQNLRQTEVIVGVTYAVAGGLAVVASLFTTRLTARFGHGPTACLAALFSGLAALAIPFAEADWRLWMAMVANGVAMALGVVYRVAQVSVRQRLCPPELNGRMNATIQVTVWSAVTVGALVAGVLAELLTVPTTLWIGAGGQVLVAVIMLSSRLRRVRELPSAAVLNDDGATETASDADVPIKTGR